MAAAQALLEALAAGVVGMDNQTALAVQSLLESQTVTTESAQSLEEDDVFQCGKCKKQFNSLPNFLNHKQSACTTTANPQTVLKKENVLVLDQQALSAATNNAFNRQNGSFQQTVAAYSGIPASPLAQQLGHQMVLTDDLMAFTAIDQNIQTPQLQVATSIQGNPFLPQAQGPLTPKSSSTNAVYTSVSSASVATSMAPGYGTVVPSGSIHIQSHVPSVQTVTVATSSSEPKNMTSLLIKPPGVATVQKPAKKGPGSNIITVITDLETSHGTMINKPRRTKTNAISAGLEDLQSTKKKLKCQYCDRSFTKNFDLQQHIRSHTGERPFQCIVCGRAFAQKSNVKKHMQTHKVWPSGQGKTLPDQPEPEDVDVPSSNHPATPADQAKMAAETAESAEDLKNSLKHIYIDNSYVCQYCNQKYKTYFQLKSHMTMHKSEQVYKCILKSCGMTFADLDSFLEHTKTHETEMQYRCHMCNKQFPSLYELGVHQYSHSLYPNQGPKPGPRYFRCIKCNNKYSTPEALDHHMHTVTHNFPCVHCDKIFTCERYLRRHLPIHGTKGEYECDICEKSFKTDHYLKVHMLIHSGEKPFKCDQCSAAFNRKDKLKRHMTIHDPVKKYKCPFRNHTGCTKAFNRPDKLKAHIIVHSGIKPFTCKECGKPFSRRPHLQEHEMTHRNEYKFRCDNCGRGFHRIKLFDAHKCKTNNKRAGEVKQKKMFETRHRKRKVGRPRGKMVSLVEESVKSAFQKKYPFKRSTRTRYINQEVTESKELNPSAVSRVETVTNQTITSAEAPLHSTETHEDHSTTNLQALPQTLMGGHRVVTDADGRVAVVASDGQIYVQTYDGAQTMASLSSFQAIDGSGVTMTALSAEQSAEYTNGSGEEVVPYELHEVAVNMNYDSSSTMNAAALGATLIASSPHSATIVVAQETSAMLNQANGDSTQQTFHFQTTGEEEEVYEEASSILEEDINIQD